MDSMTQLIEIIHLPYNDISPNVVSPVNRVVALTIIYQVSIANEQKQLNNWELCLFWLRRISAPLIMLILSTLAIFQTCVTSYFAFESSISGFDELDSIDYIH